MNYYERHIGDYLKDTAHLSLLHHGIYARLLDVYYTREQGFKEGETHRLIGARTRDEKAATVEVLEEFFSLVGGVWEQGRCDEEIARYRDKQEKAKRSADARWSASGRNANAFRSGDANAMRTHSEGNAPSLQSPDTSLVAELQTAAPAQSAAPPPPPAFDGKNAEVLNGKAVVCIAGAFELPEAWGLDAEALGWQPKEVLYQAERFRQHWTVGKGAGKRRNVKGWRQSWSNWLSIAAEKRK